MCVLVRFFFSSFLSLLRSHLIVDELLAQRLQGLIKINSASVGCVRVFCFSFRVLISALDRVRVDRRM